MWDGEVGQESQSKGPLLSVATLRCEQLIWSQGAPGAPHCPGSTQRPALGWNFGVFLIPPSFRAYSNQQ